MQTRQSIHSILNSYLGKSGHGHGEGSRGGKVVGHTKSGRPIYAHGGTFHGHDAHFGDANDRQNENDIESTTIVPLGGGFTARYRSVAEDAEHVDPDSGYSEGDWSLHGPDGEHSKTHGLDDSFLKHPEAERIAAETDHHARANAASHLESRADQLMDSLKYD